MSRIVASAIETALEGDGHNQADAHRSRHRGLKAVAAGAAVVAAAKVASSQAPKFSKVGALTALGKATRLPDMIREAPDRVLERIEQFERGL